MAFGRLSAARKPQTPISEINVTPLVDVMLVLVVIFILAAPMLAATLRVQLPPVDAAQPVAVAQPAAMELEITAQGDLWLQGQQVQEDALRQQLQTLAQRNPQAELQLQADARVPYGRVAQVMGWAHAMGLTRIGFVTQPQASEHP